MPSGNILAMLFLNDDAPVGVDDVAIVSSVSRNQARKAAYCNWIDWTGKGYNTWPYRHYMKVLEARR